MPGDIVQGQAVGSAHDSGVLKYGGVSFGWAADVVEGGRILRSDPSCFYTYYVMMRPLGTLLKQLLFLFLKFAF